ncbi:MAG: hypothetical protein AAF219_04310 [Myxococcota bacterium]
MYQREQKNQSRDDDNEFGYSVEAIEDEDLLRKLPVLMDGEYPSTSPTE